MKKIKIFFLLSFFVYSLFSQEMTSVNGRYVAIHSLKYTNIPKMKESPKGSTYLLDNFTNANILLKDSTIIFDYKINFNLSTKNIEFFIEDANEYAYLNISKAERIYLKKNNQTEIYESCPQYLLNYPDIGDCDIIKLIYKGDKASLIYKYTLELIPANYNLALDAGNPYDTYAAKRTIYILKDGKSYLARPSKASLLFILRDKKKELKDFIENNNLNLRNEKHQALLLEYYNKI